MEEKIENETANDEELYLNNFEEEEDEEDEAPVEETPTSDDEDNKGQSSQPETDLEDEKKDEDDKPVEEKKQKGVPNQAYAELRRQQEQIEKLKKEAYNKGLIESVRGVNPYTNEPIKSNYDVQEFLTMREIEEKGLDPIVDYHKFLKEKHVQSLKNEAPAFDVTQDLNEFMETFPDVDLKKLTENEDFSTFAAKRVRKEPLKDIYEDFINMQTIIESRVEERAKEKAKELIAKTKATPGALSSKVDNDADYYSQEQVQKMTQEEVSKNYSKIKKSMENWYK